MTEQRFARRMLGLAVLWALCSSAYAQESAQGSAQNAGASSSQKEAKTLDAIKVVAEKREEKIQDVPIVVNVLPAQQLQDAGVRDIKDLQILVPSMNATTTQNAMSTTVRIWNVGTTGDNPGLESSVGVVIDGVYRPRTGVAYGDLGEIDHIEVLKGPQGTLFGKNTSAGVINIITAQPEFVQHAQAEATLGNYGAWGLSGSYTNALSDNVAFRVYAADRERDGFWDVVNGKGPGTHDTDNNEHYHTFRGQLLWKPSDTVKVDFSADYTDRNENCCATSAYIEGSTAPLINKLAGGKGIAAPGDDPADRVAYLNRDTTQAIKDKGVSATVTWDTPWLGGATFTSVTADRSWNAVTGGDLDFTGADLLYRNGNRQQSFNGFRTFSQEFRLSGKTDSVDWLVGAFYADEVLNRNNSYGLGSDYEAYLSTLAFGGLAATGVPIRKPNPAAFFSQIAGVTNGFTGLSGLDHYRQSTKSGALFTNNTWHATDALDLTMGLRYTHDNKQLESQYSNPNGTPACAAVLQNPAAHVAAGLRAQGVTPTPALIAALAPTIVGTMCLPWSNANFANFQPPNQQMTENEWTGTLKAAYHWNDQVMTYVSGARGYKSGGYNLDRVQNGVTPATDTSFPGEFVNSYELGAKTTWLGGNLLWNSTLFYQDYKNYQFNGFLGVSWAVLSIPTLTSKGLDNELMWQTGIQGLMLQAGLTYADTRFGKNIPGALFQAPAGALNRLPGAHPSFAPEWSGTAGITYEKDIAHNLLVRFNISAKYTSSENAGTDLMPEKDQNPFTVVNARVGLGSSDGRWMVELWGQNLTNALYYEVAFNNPLQSPSVASRSPQNTFGAGYGDPRTYGLTLRVKTD